MSDSKIVKANQKIAETVVEGNKKIADGVTEGFQKISDAVAGGYTKIEDRFVDRFLAKEGETVEDAKKRLEEEKKNLPVVNGKLIRRILSYLTPYWPQFLLVFVTILLSAVVGLLPSIITGRIVDEALVGQDMRLLIELLILAFVTLTASRSRHPITIPPLRTTCYSLSAGIPQRRSLTSCCTTPRSAPIRYSGKVGSNFNRFPWPMCHDGCAKVPTCRCNWPPSSMSRSSNKAWTSC